MLDNSGSGQPAEGVQSSIETAILSDLRPVSPIPGVFGVIAALIVCLSGVVAAANWHLGIAGWQARSFLQLSVNFSLLGLSVLLLASALAHQMMPGSRKPAAFWLGGPLVALLAANTAMFGYHWSPKFVPIGLQCWEIGVSCAALSAPLFWIVLRRGLSLHPIANGATAGLLAGLAGVIVLEIFCPYLDRLHISAWHLGAAATSMAAGAALGAIQNAFKSRP
jgi:hypothetical protein